MFRFNSGINSGTKIAAEIKIAVVAQSNRQVPEKIKMKGYKDMKYITSKEAAVRWNLADRTVRHYCDQGRIPDAYQEDGAWYIPAKAAKPKRAAPERSPLPPLVKKLLKQSTSQHYHGLYDYVQINMVYSNNRMASNRLTRNQVEMLYKYDKIATVNEALKVNDIIETRNHFLCVNLILSSATKPLTQVLLLELRELLVSPHCTHKRKATGPIGYRTTETVQSLGFGAAPDDIPAELNRLFTEYEKKAHITLEDILDLHVRFERIRPFEDCNGRIGRLLMLKECLRHEILPFIIDDKRRSGYLKGLRCWDDDESILMEVCTEAQIRFAAQIELQMLAERQAIIIGKKPKPSF